MDRLKGKAAIVTGSTSGVGTGIAKMFGAEGAPGRDLRPQPGARSACGSLPPRGTPAPEAFQRVRCPMSFEHPVTNHTFLSAIMHDLPVAFDEVLHVFVAPLVRLAGGQPLVVLDLALEQVKSHPQLVHLAQQPLALVLHDL